MRKQRRISTDHERVSEIHIHWVDVPSRQIWIHGYHDLSSSDFEDMEEPGVEYRMATITIKNLHILLLNSPDLPVTIHLHTCGGVWEEGMAIYDTIKAMPYETNIISYTHARSMSSLILQAGTTRLMMPNSVFMFHWGTIDTGGHSKQVYAEIDQAKKSDEAMLNIYVNKIKEHAKNDMRKWSENKLREHLTKQIDSKCDVFLSAREAVEWGLADGIVEKFSRRR